MALIELPPDDLEESRLNITKQLKQSDAAAAKEAYTSLLKLISSPWVILQGRAVRGTAAIQWWLNVVILLSRAQWLLVILFVGLGIFVASRYFVGIIFVAIIWWLLNGVQTRLNVELAARYITLTSRMTEAAQAANNVEEMMANLQKTP